MKLFTKTQTTTDWHDGSFTFKAILHAAVYPSFTVDSNDGKTVMKIYDEQTSTCSEQSTNKKPCLKPKPPPNKTQLLEKR